MLNRRTIKTTLELIFYILIPISIAGLITCGIIGYLSSIILLIILILLLVYKVNKNYDITANLLFPVMLSATQNIYLGIFSPYLSSFEVQTLIVLNFIYGILLLLLLLIRKYRILVSDGKWKQKIFYCCVIIIVYCIITTLIKRGNILAIFSSFRNIISIYLFFMIGLLASRQTNMRKLYNIFLWISVIVLLIGFIDVFSNGEIWIKWNITELWTKKGIRLQPSGLPTNFYSSETINGERIRRMVSSFADPVNLGSFFNVTLLVTWYTKKNKMLIATLIAIALTVSKGALLGILVFLCVYAYYNYSRPVFYTIFTITGLVGILFLIYAAKTSANSVFLHIDGLLSAFQHMIRNPIGDGLGSNGVLAKQFSGITTNSDITETGLGMIISQIGVIGLYIFVIFFKELIKKATLINNKKEKILMISLLLSLVVNICFNEVALSPNTCAIYMLLIGVCLGQNINRKELR